MYINNTCAINRSFTTIIVISLVMMGVQSCRSGNDSKSMNSPSSVTGNKDSSISIDSIVKRGEYLVAITGCNDCHSPKVMGPNGPAIDTNRTLSGFPDERPIPQFDPAQIVKGFVMVNGDMTAAGGPWGTTFAANITSDETGIGNWSEQQFKTALTHGKFRGLDGGRPLMPPMPWQNFVNISNEDLTAIFQYLKATKPVKNLVPAFQPATVQ